MLAEIEDESLAAKRGRPTDRPKDSRVTARVEISVKKILDDYCDKHRITQAEGVRRAILKLKEDNEERSGARSTQECRRC